MIIHSYFNIDYLTVHSTIRKIKSSLLQLMVVHANMGLHGTGISEALATNRTMMLINALVHHSEVAIQEFLLREVFSAQRTHILTHHIHPVMIFSKHLGV